MTSKTFKEAEAETKVCSHVTEDKTGTNQETAEELDTIPVSAKVTYYNYLIAKEVSIKEF